MESTPVEFEIKKYTIAGMQKEQLEVGTVFLPEYQDSVGVEKLGLEEKVILLDMQQEELEEKDVLFLRCCSIFNQTDVDYVLVRIFASDGTMTLGACRRSEETFEDEEGSAMLYIPQSVRIFMIKGEVYCVS